MDENLEEIMVSIIIPVYNRDILVGLTLDSLKNQNFENWECIVVDDHSTDHTLQVLKTYQDHDHRIKYFKRPENLEAGANSCRNYGFQKSKGSYIIWFDSDDLMTPDHISAKMQKISGSNADFVVARTQNFRDGELLEPYHYEIKDYGIKASDFILLKIHWYTYDVMLKREIAEEIDWNDNMKSWQDYNYFCKMLLVTENGVYLDKILTQRRLHEKSIQKELNKTPRNFKKELLENRYHTFQDIENLIDKKTKSELLYGLMNLEYDMHKIHAKSRFKGEIFSLIIKYLGYQSLFYFRVALFFVSKLKKGYYFLEKAKSRNKLIK